MVSLISVSKTWRSPTYRGLVLPEEMKLYNGASFLLSLADIMISCLDLVEIYLSYPSNSVMNFIYENHKDLLETLGQYFLSALNLQLYADCIHTKGAPLNNYWGFIDWTAWPICRPEEMQRVVSVVYNGRKRVHAIKVSACGNTQWNNRKSICLCSAKGCCRDSDMLA